MDLLEVADEWDNEPRMKSLHDTLLASIRSTNLVRKGDHLHELGAGTGALGFSLLEDVGESGQLTCSDGNAMMVRVVMLRALKAGTDRRVKAVQTHDSNRAAASSPLFDTVVTALALHTVHDKAKVLAEVRRSLKEGGRVVLCEMLDDDTARLVTGGGGGGGGPHTPPTPSGFTVEGIEAMLRAAGFASVTHHQTVAWKFDDRLPTPISVLVVSATV